MGIKKILFQLVVGTLNFETLFSLHAVIDKNKKDKSAKKITQYSTENDTDDQEMDNIEVAIRNAHEPLELAEEREEIEVSGLRGRQVNAQEERNWRGDAPLSDFPPNNDPNPEIIVRPLPLEFEQGVIIRYLRPPTPQPAGDLVIIQEDDIMIPHPPPIILRQRAATPEAIIYRETPPEAPEPIERQEIRIPGNRIPRRVILEKMPELPPQQIILERWLPYPQMERRVVFHPAKNVAPRLRNTIIKWEKSIRG